MNNRNTSGIGQRLLRTYLFQGLLIGLAMIASVLIAGMIIKNVLVKQALISEADYFWQSYQLDPNFPLPDTMNLHGFLFGGEDTVISDTLAGLAPGFHELPGHDDFSVAYVSEREGKRLVLGFAAKQVNRLTFYFGLLPLMVVLLVLYLTLWWAYRVSQRAISPVIGLAQQVAKLDPAEATPDTFKLSDDSLKSDHEVVVLSEALMRFTQRLNHFIDRERNFTRDVSHELRSPLTVIKLAAEMLQSEQQLEPSADKSVTRILKATDDMEELTNAFLLLARESDRGVTSEQVCVNDVVDEEIERVKPLIGEKPISIQKNYVSTLWVETSDKALSIVIGNLLRNAINYTDKGHVDINIAEYELIISDSGIGMPNPQKAFGSYYRGARQRGGYGVGLSIVKRFSDRFGWQVDIDSKVDIGTTVTLSFPAQNS